MSSHHSHNQAVSLEGLCVLLTRPETASRGLFHLLTEKGAAVNSLPTLTITALEESPEIRDCFMNIDRYDSIVFISPNAAELGLDLIDKYWPQLPLDIQWFAVGQKTAEILLRGDIIATTPALNADSEGLLALNTLQNCHSKKILIVRGKGGREQLATVLQQRGASVSYAEVYERSCPEYSPEEVKSQFIEGKPQAIVVYSGESLQNLVQIGDKAGVLLRNKVILVPGKRVETLARSLQFDNILVPGSLQESDILNCLQYWWEEFK